MEKRVEAYTLVDFIKAIQAHVKDGWLIDFEDNTHVPTGFAGHYYCRLAKGTKLAAILKPKAVESSETTEDFHNSIDEQLKAVAEAEPFVPSVVFSMQQVEQPVTVKKAVGRPKSEQI